MLKNIYIYLSKSCWFIKAHMHINRSRSGSHKDEISVLGFLLFVVSQHTMEEITSNIFSGTSDCGVCIDWRSEIGRGFEIQECPKPAGMVTCAGRTRRLSLGFNGQESGGHFFSLYVSMIAVTNWLLSNNLESDMNQQSGMWTSKSKNKTFYDAYMKQPQ